MFLDYGNMELLNLNQILPISGKLSFEVCAREYIVDSELC
jgi:hypothetical protein